MSHRLSTIEAAVQAIAAGKIVIVMDAEDREHEGDFICAAEKVTPEIVNFMITHGRGQLCMLILPEVAKRLELPPIVQDNTAPFKTAFTVPVDHVSGRTGVTAPERAKTIQEILNPSSKPADFARPGHLYPLVAKEGGVLRRAGHTECAVDLARMAGLKPAGVLIEILGQSGDRATPDELYALAARFGLEIITIESLIRYRRRTEKLVYRRRRPGCPRATAWPRSSSTASSMRSRIRWRSSLASQPRGPSHWCGCTRPASPAISCPRCAATAATSFSWPCR